MAAPKAKADTLTKEDKEAFETIAYEVGMVNATSQMVTLAETQKAAALESHLIHVRGLMEFFKHQQVGTNLWAGNYTKVKWPPKDAKAIYVVLNRGIDGKGKPIVERISKRLAHMDKARGEHGHTWDPTFHNRAMQALAGIFMREVKEEYRPALERLMANMGITIRKVPTKP